MRLVLLFALLVTSLLSLPIRADACTSVLVSKGASSDGSTLVTYAADSHDIYGELVVTPARDHAPGTTREIYEWDTGKRLGEVSEVPHTYAVIGNMNEHQLAIAESTFGGREELHDPTGIIDYGSLISLALERAKTAREAIAVMTSLVQTYGYASSGESFSIADPNEVWLLELIGKGPGVKGAVWAARRLPDGTVSAHANQARIRELPNDAGTLFAKDVVSFARSKGYFTGKDGEFSFADAYAPLTAEALRFCEARVYSVFRRAAPSLQLSADYVMGKPGAKRLPLWVKPDQKLGVKQTMELMRDHFEGTPLDMSQDVGAGPFGLPYRWRPLTWESGGVTYGNERAISTQQTGFSFVSQSRAGLPFGVLWFGVDDTYSTVYMPMYTSLREAPAALSAATGSFHRFSWDSAFWVFNFVANLSYARYQDMIVDVRRVQGELEGRFLAEQAGREAHALKLATTSAEHAREYLSQVSHSAVAATLSRWRTLGEQLLVKYLDGNVRDETGKAGHPPYPQAWYDRIARETGAHLQVTKLPGEEAPLKRVHGAGYFHSRAELGEWADAAAAGVDFETQRLVLLPGKDRCARPPMCCAEAKPTTVQGKPALLLVPPKAAAKSADAPGCGKPGWLFVVPKGSELPLYSEGH